LRVFTYLYRNLYQSLSCFFVVFILNFCQPESPPSRLIVHQAEPQSPSTAIRSHRTMHQGAVIAPGVAGHEESVALFNDEVRC